jgi:hypothetical protein
MWRVASYEFLFHDVSNGIIYICLNIIYLSLLMNKVIKKFDFDQTRKYLLPPFSKFCYWLIHK